MSQTIIAALNKRDCESIGLVLLAAQCMVDGRSIPSTMRAELASKREHIIKLTGRVLKLSKGIV